MSRDANDPVAQAIHELIDHGAEADRRIEHVLEELQRLRLRIDVQRAGNGEAITPTRILD